MKSSNHNLFRYAALIGCALVGAGIFFQLGRCSNASGPEVEKSELRARVFVFEGKRYLGLSPPDVKDVLGGQGLVVPVHVAYIESGGEAYSLEGDKLVPQPDEDHRKLALYGVKNIVLLRPGTWTLWSIGFQGGGNIVVTTPGSYTQDVEELSRKHGPPLWKGTMRLPLN